MYDSSELSSSSGKRGENDKPPPKVLIWQKLPAGNEKYIPAAREGHSIISKGLSVFVFGGIETAQVILERKRNKSTSLSLYIHNNSQLSSFLRLLVEILIFVAR